MKIQINFWAVLWHACADFDKPFLDRIEDGVRMQLAKQEIEYTNEIRNNLVRQGNHLAYDTMGTQGWAEQQTIH